MKKFTANAVVAAIGLVWSATALAGSIPAPATTTKYAVESMTSGTDITLPNIDYRMGVDRTTAQDFTVIITPSAGSTFTAASCTTAIPTIVLGGAGAGAFTATVKRASTTECAYEIDVTTAFVRGGGTVDLRFAGLVFDTHNLATAGNTAGVTIALKDLGETAFIDNSGSLSVNVAQSGNALTLVATQDTGTTANVNDTAGPLFGFVAQNNDTATTAAASFLIRNNNDGTNTWMRPDGTTPWNFVTDGTNVAVTITGNFAQMAAVNGFTVASSTGPAMTNPTVSGNTATFTVLPANIPANGNNATITTTFTTARNASMGTSRTFGVSAVGDVVTGADVTLAGNSTWWVWNANASQLMTSYFTTNSIYLTRFFLLNTSSNAVTYSADCYSETGNTITYGSARTGTLSANGLTAVNARDVCTFAGASRGAMIFTINAPINAVKGSYQYIDQTTLNGVVVPMVRPYNQANTTE